MSDSSRASSSARLEQQMAEIWAAVLKVPSVGLDDDFFDLGGHSLLATKLTSRVRKAFGVDLSIRTLFDSPTVAQLCVEVARAGGGPAEAAVDGDAQAAPAEPVDPRS